MFGLAVAEGLVPAFEARATPGALAMPLAIGAVAPGLAGQTASSAADRLARLGVPVPRWAAQLDESLRVTDACGRTTPTASGRCWPVCSVGGGRSLAFAVSVDKLDSGAATDLALLDPDELHEVLDSFQALGRAAGKAMVKETLDPGDFRWQVEKALATRAFHDGPDIHGLRRDADGFPGNAMLACAPAGADGRPPDADEACRHHMGTVATTGLMCRSGSSGSSAMRPRAGERAAMHRRAPRCPAG